MAEYTLMPSPKRSGYVQGIPAPGFGEGVWTPVLEFGQASVGITYGTQAGGWARIGRVVTAWFHIILTSKGSSTGEATINGLPFAPADIGCNRVSGISLAYWTNMTSSLVVAGVIPDLGQTLRVFGSTAAATDLLALDDADFANNTELAAHVSYFTAE